VIHERTGLIGIKDRRGLDIDLQHTCTATTAESPASVSLTILPRSQALTLGRTGSPVIRPYQMEVSSKRSMPPVAKGVDALMLLQDPTEVPRRVRASSAVTTATGDFAAGRPGALRMFRALWSEVLVMRSSTVCAHELVEGRSQRYDGQ
jgi:hypothetical protein